MKRMDKSSGQKMVFGEILGYRKSIIGSSGQKPELLVFFFQISRFLGRYAYLSINFFSHGDFEKISIYIFFQNMSLYLKLQCLRTQYLNVTRKNKNDSRTFSI